MPYLTHVFVLDKKNYNIKKMLAVITGATKGIGLAIAEALAAENYHLALCARQEADLVALKNDFANRFPAIEVLIFKVDMQQKKDVLAFAAAISQKWESINVLVNNAGVFLSGDILESPEGQLEQLLQTNFYSAYHLTRALIPLILRGKNKRHIFNMCSVASLAAYPNGGLYSISKFALLGFSKVLREELKEKGVKVTAILPGATWSNAWAGVELPESRLMQAADIAEVVTSALRMSAAAVVEDIVLRPQLGDL